MNAAAGLCCRFESLHFGSLCNSTPSPLSRKICLPFAVGPNSPSADLATRLPQQKGSFSFFTRDRTTFATTTPRKVLQERSGPVAAAFGVDLLPPPIDRDLQELQEELGAEFSPEGVVVTFNNDADALEASKSGFAVVDLSHFGRLRVYDDDRIRFLHNQSTADFNLLKPGQGGDTVFVTNTARTIDLVTAYIKESSVLLVTSPSQRRELLPYLDKFIFFADKVKLQDVTDQCFMLALVGPQSSQVLEDLRAGDLVGKPYGTHAMFDFQGSPVMIAVGSGLATDGYTVIADAAAAGDFWKTLMQQGGVPMGARAWERLRILQGRPVPGAELTPDYNPLEAGLWNTISLTKGCYIGQETIARLITYNGVKQHLWGIQLSEAVEPGTVITLDDAKVGKVTSVTETESGFFALGYIRSKVCSEPGLTVHVGNAVGKVVEIPFVRRTLDA
ncbi:Glycine cleavage T-protein family [Klebsormidium nitens]|uniref:Glycine cleavage T-protein family n=1 Tax=Klebsormidium nitens TaxID=105231 RepID=A0A1Y1IE70_KLENI|nr:Glycine cleavage T-protein family [Klebsormidium nitens]|eukprot:GAQ87006.1 Glycine cleavage T-protein family [Klebsormidium nitens]